MPGRGKLTVTGQLGDVMRESAQAALSYVRGHAATLVPELPGDYFATHDIHLHVPAGAVPKDGPSAGITMATALMSLMSGRPVRGDVAMTGEVTLTGQVLPIGGLKEKALAAQRAGIAAVIAPQRNEPELEDFPPHLRDAMTFTWVSDVPEVFAAALEGAGGARPPRDGRRGGPQARRRPEPVAAAGSDGWFAEGHPAGMLAPETQAER